MSAIRDLFVTRLYEASLAGPDFPVFRDELVGERPALVLLGPKFDDVVAQDVRPCQHVDGRWINGMVER